MSMQPMSCSCGHRWQASPDEGGKFCPRCGEPVRSENLHSPAITAEPLTVLPVLPKRPRLDDDDDWTSRRRLPRRQPLPPPPSGLPASAIVGIVVVVAVIGLGVIGGVMRAARVARMAAIPPMPPPSFSGVDYYDDWVREFGIPKGINRLTEAQARQNGFSVRFTRRSGQVTKVEFVDSRLRLIPSYQPEEHFYAGGFAHRRPECSLTFTYNSRGSVMSETAYSAEGQELWTLTYNTTADTGQYTRVGAPFAPYWLGSAYVALRNDGSGREVETTLTDAAGKMKANRDGVAIIRRQFDTEGVVTQQTYHDVAGKPVVVPSLGNAGYRATFDNRGRPTLLTALGADLKPVRCHRGFATFRAEYKDTDHFDGIPSSDAVYSYFDENDKPAAIYPGKYARMRQRFNIDGDVIEAHFFAADGKPAFTDGHCGWKCSYDPNGHKTAEEYQDAAGRPALIGRGYAILRQTHNPKGDVLEEWYLGVDRKPIVSRDGYARVTMCYDADDNLTESAYFDVKGDPVMIAGRARWKRSYEGKHRVTEEENFDSKGRLCAQGDGSARTTWEYDAAGQLIAINYFGADSKPIVAKSAGCARQTWKRGKGYRMLEHACFGADGKPCVGAQGFSKLVNRHNAGDRVVESAYFAADGKPMMVEGMAAIAYSYNSHGQQTQMRYLGIDGKLRAQKDGVARTEYKYDDRNRRTETLTFDAAGIPVASEQGYARLARKYGNEFQIVEEAYFGPDGKAAVCKHGYARWTARYEGTRQVEQLYFDVAGKQVMTRVRALYVDEGGPTGKAGLKAGDVLVSYGGKTIATVRELYAMQENEHDIPAKALIVERDGKELTLQVALGLGEDDFEEFVPTRKPEAK